MDESYEDYLRRLDCPAHRACATTEVHSAPTMEQRIAEEIERDLAGRRGLKQEWGRIDEETRDEIRDEWAGIVARVIKEQTIEFKRVEVVAEPLFLLEVFNAKGALVQIDFDGNITYGEGYDPDETARVFWDAVAKRGAGLITPSEALFGFAAWLTAREEPVVFSSHHDAAVVVELVGEWMAANALPSPRDGWEKRITHPKAEEEELPSFEDVIGIFKDPGGEKIPVCRCGVPWTNVPEPLGGWTPGCSCPGLDGDGPPADGSVPIDPQNFPTKEEDPTDGTDSVRETGVHVGTDAAAAGPGASGRDFPAVR